jgi:hypothetical protein
VQGEAPYEPGVIVSTEPSASIWEVTRLILNSPGTSPSAIAHAHGFSPVEVAELLPIVLENLTADFSTADGAGSDPVELDPPAPRPDETPEEHAERYLRELADGGGLDIIAYDSLGATAADPTFLDAPAGDAHTVGGTNGETAVSAGELAAFGDGSGGPAADEPPANPPAPARPDGDPQFDDPQFDIDLDSDDPFMPPLAEEARSAEADTPNEPPP